MGRDWVETSWLPDLNGRSGPKYLRIADAMAEDIYGGRLVDGARLPTHRDLAWRLGVTVGTVTRAYLEGERRGLIVGEVGRGSFVRAGARMSSAVEMPRPGDEDTIELGVNRTPPGLMADAVAEGLVRLAGLRDIDQLLNYHASGGLPRHRAACARWLETRGLYASADQVAVTSGAEHAIAASLMAFNDPGAPVLVEPLTWSGTRALATMLRMPLRAVPMDEEGITPDGLDAQIRASGARIAYLQPTVHNPTTAVMSMERRREVAEVIRRHGILVIEDDVYGLLHPDAPAPLASLVPEQVIYATSASKVLSPGLRVGCALLPDAQAARFAVAARAVNWMAPPPMAALLSFWVEDGVALDMTKRIREEVAVRLAIAKEILAGLDMRSCAGAFHVWLTLPEPWRARELVAAARRQGLTLMDTEMFVPGRNTTPHAVRVSITAPRSHDELRTGFSRLRAILSAPPEIRLMEA
ncbi:MAG: PLP-dependent aminotransferase family protein [Rhodospirillaceae bacterium]|nr:PLP-dependent aminotransferase family protein [Rhodospirillaceae bacterium]